ncbi:MAG TPA: tyrosine-type recombinase/integrase [Chloroflexia bacterium]|nr:tyrosine-type recombinase/integrase [Chloroflexia bacterium]
MPTPLDPPDSAPGERGGEAPIVVAAPLPPLTTGARPPASERPEAVYLAGLAPTGRRSMAARLRTVAGVLGAPSIEAVPWERLRYAHVAAVRAALEERELAPASINATLAALRGVAAAAWNLGALPVEELARIRQVKPVRGSRLPAGRLVKAGELRALLEACAADPSSAGARDAALIGLLYAAGLRRGELATLQVADYTSAERRLTVRHGKGRKERLVPIAGGAAVLLEEWLAARGPAPGPLLLPINKGGHIGTAPLSTQAVYKALTRRAADAGLTTPVSPHDMRRTFVGDLLDAGADIATVQQLAGHASVTTTARYDRRGEAAKQRAVDLLHLPRVERKPR